MLKYSVFERIQVGKVTCINPALWQENVITTIHMPICPTVSTILSKEYFDFMVDISGLVGQ